MEKNPGDNEEVPKEIPVRKNPEETTPLKDPSRPSKSNPLNPKKDDPTKR